MNKMMELIGSPFNRTIVELKSADSPLKVRGIDLLIVQ